MPAVQVTLAAGIKIFPQLFPAQDRPQYAQAPCALMTLLVLTVSSGAQDLPWRMSLCSCSACLFPQCQRTATLELGTGTALLP